MCIDDLCVVELEHTVKGGEDAIQISAEAVFEMSACRFRKQQSTLNDQLKDVFETLEALFYWFLFLEL